MAAPAQSAGSLLLINARVFTGQGENTFVEALAVKDGRVVAIGGSAELQQKYPSLDRVRRDRDER
jgi:predicted amidohydrolase YtcJ